MPEVLHPSTKLHSSKRNSKETDVLSLDDLLERYLHLLDRYQTLQQCLTQLLSRGYLSLAQANFSNSNHVRYGQEVYDDRMQASARVFIGQSSPSFSAMEPRTQETILKPDGDGVNYDFSAVKDSTIRIDGLPPSKGTEEIGPNVSCDPLKWFGILVPSALRTSQKIFKDAVADLIPALASTSKEMREVEIEVRRVRKTLRRAI